LIKRINHEPLIAKASSSMPTVLIEPSKCRATALEKI
jgi:hypothetical protein